MNKTEIENKFEEKQLSCKDCKLARIDKPNCEDFTTYCNDCGTIQMLITAPKEVTESEKLKFIHDQKINL